MAAMRRHPRVVQALAAPPLLLPLLMLSPFACSTLCPLVLSLCAVPWPRMTRDRVWRSRVAGVLLGAYLLLTVYAVDWCSVAAGLFDAPFETCVSTRQFHECIDIKVRHVGTVVQYTAE